MARPLALLLLLAAASAGCAGEVIPEEYRRGEAIPFGDHTLKVYRVQNRNLLGAVILSVYVRIDPEGGGDAYLDTKWFDYLRKLKLTDGAGNEYRSDGVMPAAAEHMQQRLSSSSPDSYTQIMQDFANKVEETLSSGRLPPEWDELIVLYSVPPKAKEFTLYLTNPDPKDDQPRAVIVPVFR